MGQVNREPRSITRISTTVAFDDGTLMTWAADDPLRPSFEVDGPLRSLGPLPPEALYLIPEPEPWRFAVHFQANWRAGGLVFTALPPGSAVTVSRADLERVYEYARQSDAGGGPVMARVRSALGLAGEVRS